MTACVVERTATGFRVTRDFRSLPAAMAAVSAITAVTEEAFAAPAQDLSPAIEALADHVALSQED